MRLASARYSLFNAGLSRLVTPFGRHLVPGVSALITLRPKRFDWCDLLVKDSFRTVARRNDLGRTRTRKCPITGRTASYHNEVGKGRALGFYALTGSPSVVEGRSGEKNLNNFFF